VKDPRGRGFKDSSEKQKEYLKKGTYILVAGDLGFSEESEL